MGNAKRDENYVPTLLAVSNVDGVTPVVLYADPTTHRLLVSAAAGALSGLTDVTITSAAQGDILYYNGTDWVNLAAGTSGRFLKTQGAGANPLWDTPTAGAAGTDTQVQFNDGGSSLGGDAGFVFNKTTNVATLGGLNVSGLTASELVATDASKNLVSLAVVTYPSITEISYVKGVTSSIQTQLGAKAPLASPTFTGTVTLPVGLTGVLRADAGVVSVDTDVTDLVSAASDILAGKVELATDAETVTGTDTARATTPANITAKMAAPGAIGGTTPGTGKFTTVETTGNIELGHATDTTLSRVSAGVIAVEGVTVPTISSTNTLTNKRITKRTGTTTSSATPTINTDNVDEYYITAQAEAITSFTTNLSGTPTLGQGLFISVIGTAARAITMGASFANGPVAIPTTTVGTTQLSMFYKWDGSIWRCYATGSTV